jgi:[acyl-carrier-protein] S-malonyltransferase
MALARQKGAKRAVMLPMSAPSHCSLMKPAADRLRERLAAIEVRPAEVPVVHNRSAAPSGSPDEIRRMLVEQLDHPVRWIEVVQFMASHGVKRLVECAPGKVLTGLSKRIAGDVECVAIQDAASLEAAIGEKKA